MMPDPKPSICRHLVPSSRPPSSTPETSNTASIPRHHPRHHRPPRIPTSFHPKPPPRSPRRPQKNVPTPRPHPARATSQEQTLLNPPLRDRSHAGSIDDTPRPPRPPRHAHIPHLGAPHGRGSCPASPEAHGRLPWRVSSQTYSLSLLLNNLTPRVVKSLFGFLFGTVLSGSAVYSYLVGEYRTSNDLLTEDIYVRLPRAFHTSDNTEPIPIGGLALYWPRARGGWQWPDDSGANRTA